MLKKTCWEAGLFSKNFCSETFWIRYTRLTMNCRIGERLSNFTFKTYEEQSFSLWDFRQKSHLILIWDPSLTLTAQSKILREREEQIQRWNWLGLKVLIVKEVSPALDPGVYAIDRFAELIRIFPLTDWSWDMLEKEFLYYEACHCG